MCERDLERDRQTEREGQGEGAGRWTDEDRESNKKYLEVSDI